jgi:hypothetical protein
MTERLPSFLELQRTDELLDEIAARRAPSGEDRALRVLAALAESVDDPPVPAVPADLVARATSAVAAVSTRSTSSRSHRSRMPARQLAAALAVAVVVGDRCRGDRRPAASDQDGRPAHLQHRARTAEWSRVAVDPRLPPGERGRSGRPSCATTCGLAAGHPDQPPAHSRRSCAAGDQPLRVAAACARAETHGRGRGGVAGHGFCTAGGPSLDEYARGQ